MQRTRETQLSRVTIPWPESVNENQPYSDATAKGGKMLSDSRVTTAIPVKDIQRARQFYENTLGLKVAREYPDGSIEFQCGQNTGVFAYQTPENAGKNPATLLSWEVEDLEGTVKELQGKGVKFEEYDMPGLKTVNGIATMGEGDQQIRGAWFKDPDGNILNIGQIR